MSSPQATTTECGQCGQPHPARVAAAVRVVRAAGFDVVFPDTDDRVLRVEPCMCGCGGIPIVDGGSDT